MTDMEKLEQKFEELSNLIPEYESDVWGAINSLEKASFSAVEKGQKKLEVAISRLNEVDELISSAFLLSPLSPKAHARLNQCLVSIRPRLNSYIEQLKNLIANPPTKSKYAEIDDVSIFSKDESPNETLYVQNDESDESSTTKSDDHADNNQQFDINVITDQNESVSQINNKEKAQSNKFLEKDESQQADDQNNE